MSMCGFCGDSPAYIDHECAEQSGPRRFQSLVTVTFPQDVLVRMYGAARETLGADDLVIEAAETAMFRNDAVIWDHENKVPSI